MTWPLAKPASGYIGLSRFDSDSVRPSISTSTRLGAATRRQTREGAGRAVELEPDGRAPALADAPATGQPLDDVEPEAPAARKVGRAPANRARAVVGVVDLDVERPRADLEHDVELRSRVAAAVPHAVGYELRDQQGDVRQNVLGDATTELIADQPTST